MNLSLQWKNQNQESPGIKYTTQLKKNGYLIVQAVLNKFTAEIQNANSINKKVVDFNSVFGVELQVKSGFKSFLKQIFQICKSFK